MIRLADARDLPRIQEIYQIARDFMAQNGNETQWGTSYPPQELLEQDLQEEQLYVYVQDDVIHGVFVFSLGEDPSYLRIEDGAWLNDAPYGTVHRIASDGAVRGVFAACIDYCKQKMDNIRIDTHEKNAVMQHLIAKSGFQRCGTIYLDNGAPRIAYQYVS